jgi:hypothetical protein
MSLLIDEPLNTPNPHTTPKHLFPLVYHHTHTASFTAFGGFFVFQALWVFIVTLPVALLNATNADIPVGARDAVGWALWGLGFVFEVLGDASKDAFMADPNNRGRIIMSGVWGLTRHPNYFGVSEEEEEEREEEEEEAAQGANPDNPIGLSLFCWRLDSHTHNQPNPITTTTKNTQEITLWLGLYISSSASFDKPNSLPGAYAAAILSPLFTAVILLFLSGMPLGEERYNRRYGREPWFLDYRARTSPLVPLPPALYSRLPLSVKRALLLELPLYEKGLPGPVDISPSASARLPASQ